MNQRVHMLLGMVKCHDVNVLDEHYFRLEWWYLLTTWIPKYNSAPSRTPRAPLPTSDYYFSI